MGQLSRRQLLVTASALAMPVLDVQRAPQSGRALELRARPDRTFKVAGPAQPSDEHWYIDLVVSPVTDVMSMSSLQARLKSGGVVVKTLTWSEAGVGGVTGWSRALADADPASPAARRILIPLTFKEPAATRVDRVTFDLTIRMRDGGTKTIATTVPLLQYEPVASLILPFVGRRSSRRDGSTTAVTRSMVETMPSTCLG